MSNSLTSFLKAPEIPWTLRPLFAILQRLDQGSLEIVTPEGQQLRFGSGGEPRARLVLHQWGALRRIFSQGGIGLAECYRDGLVETDSLSNLMRLGLSNRDRLEVLFQGSPLLRLLQNLRHRLRANTRSGSRRNIRAHYDLGNEFYQLWLDPSMSYSSGLFGGRLQGDHALAQRTKYQRMLDLTGAGPGEHILEIGCGWGGFAEFAAQRGFRVTGITLSRQQLDYAQKRMRQQGVDDRVDIRLCDYRDLRGQFDHIVSIEMLEAVGEAFWSIYFSRVRELLKPGGKAAIQVISIADEHFAQYRRRSDFIQRYIFPGGMLPSPAALRQQALSAGFAIGDCQGFAADYAETLRRWRKAFDVRQSDILALGYDQSFLRLWRFYLAYCEAGFEEGQLDLLQLQLVRDPC